MAPLFRRIAETLASIPLLAFAVACEAPRDTASPVEQAPAAPTLQVVTTVLPVTLFTEAVAGECATVTSLLPAGADTHTFQGRPQDVANLRQAQVLVVNGLGLEAFLKPLLSSAENQALLTIDSSAGIKPLPLASPDHGGHGHDHHHHHGHGTDGDGDDPHIWLDPQLAVRQVNTIRDGLIQADPSCKDGYERRAAAYVKQLQDLDQQLAQQLAPYQGRSVVSFHEALGYFVKRYGLNSEALVALPEDQPTPADVKRISALLQAADVHGLLSEPGGGSAVLQALASDLKLRLEVFDPLELVPADAQRTPELYLQVMRQNGDAVSATFQP